VNNNELIKFFHEFFVFPSLETLKSHVIGILSVFALAPEVDSEFFLFRPIEIFRSKLFESVTNVLQSVIFDYDLLGLKEPLLGDDLSFPILPPSIILSDFEAIFSELHYLFGAIPDFSISNFLESVLNKQYEKLKYVKVRKYIMVHSGRLQYNLEQERKC
jgi:hypothetical protein